MKFALAPARLAFIATLCSLPAISVSSDADWLLLGDAMGGDCSLNSLIYDRTHQKGRPPSRTTDGVPFLNDDCDIGNRIILAANGEEMELIRYDGALREPIEGSRLSYSGDGYRVHLHVGNAIETFHDADTECEETWYRASVSVEHDGKVREIDGTLVGGCP